MSEHENDEMFESVLAEVPIQKLLDQALSTDPEEAASAIEDLQMRGDIATLDAAKVFLESPDPKKRAVGAEVLGQLGYPEKVFENACFDALSQAIQKETDPKVQGDIATALSHLGDARSIPLLLPFIDSPASEARFGAVMGLMGHDDPDALNALLHAMEDNDSEIRNWATYGVGAQTEADSDEIRSALAKRVHDEYVETRIEAIAGLARRGVESVQDDLIAALKEQIDLRLIEAATELASPRLHDTLIQLKDRPEVTPRIADLLDEAIARCDPNNEI